MDEQKFLLIEGCNFDDYPMGGQLIFSKYLMDVFKEQIVLVGWAKEHEPLGKMIKRNYKGFDFDLFTIMRGKKSNFRLPDRLRTFIGIAYYRKEIKRLGIKKVFTSSPEAFIIISGWKKFSICYRFAGVNNPLEHSKYKLGKKLKFIFDLFFIPKLKNAACILAAADNNSIKQFSSHYKQYLEELTIHRFPTRIDESVYKPEGNVEQIRLSLNIPIHSTIIVTVGRLANVKGWKLLLDSFKIFKETVMDAIFIFVGDGEDSNEIEKYIKLNKFEQNVLKVGTQNPITVAKYLNAGDLFVMGSFHEGWSTTLVEAMACNIPVCATDFSSARELIIDGINGFIVSDRDPKLFATKMKKAMKLKPNNSRIRQLYSKSNLKKSLFKYWIV